jgi:prophage regulatory protein
MQPDPILRLRETCKVRGRAPSTHWSDIADGLCTRGVHTGPRSVGWPESEIAAINRARVAGWTEDEIKQIVVELDAARNDTAGLTAEEIYLRMERAR